MKGTVLVTGVCGGIGAATAAHFSEEEWEVIGLDVRGGCPSDHVTHFLSVDLSHPRDVQAAFESISSSIDRIDALINNAAMQLVKPLLATTSEEWDSVIATNVRSALLCTQHVHPLMRGEGGAIVNVSSVHALATSEGKGAYAASKGALLALSRTLALELASDGIRVNAVLPGAVDTPMLHPATPDEGDAQEAMERLVERTPLHRVADPQEIAAAIYFLATPSSSFATGQAFVVDGGVLARLATE